MLFFRIQNSRKVLAKRSRSISNMFVKNYNRSSGNQMVIQKGLHFQSRILQSNVSQRVSSWRLKMILPTLRYRTKKRPMETLWQNERPRATPPALLGAVVPANFLTSSAAEELAPFAASSAASSQSGKKCMCTRTHVLFPPNLLEK